MQIANTQPLASNQIVVTFDDVSFISQVKKAISLMKGVKSVYSPRVSKKQLTPQQQYVKDSLTRALNEVKEAKRTGRALMSADDFLNEMLSDEAVSSL